MALEHPVVVYTAANNTEASLLRVLLVQAGIEAHCTEDQSPVGLWWGGSLPGIHQPQVWVDHSQVEAATALLREHDERTRKRRAPRSDEIGAVPIEITCEACGRLARFKAAQRGSVQDCPHCGAYIDVGESTWEGDWSGADEEDEPDPPQEPPPPQGLSPERPSGGRGGD